MVHAYYWSIHIYCTYNTTNWGSLPSTDGVLRCVIVVDAFLIIAVVLMRSWEKLLTVSALIYNINNGMKANWLLS